MCFSGKIDFKGKNSYLGEFFPHVFKILVFFPHVDREVIVHHNVLRGFLVFTIIKVNTCGGKTNVLEN